MRVLMLILVCAPLLLCLPWEGTANDDSRSTAVELYRQPRLFLSLMSALATLISAAVSSTLAVLQSLGITEHEITVSQREKVIESAIISIRNQRNIATLSIDLEAQLLPSNPPRAPPRRVRICRLENIFTDPSFDFPLLHRLIAARVYTGPQ